MLTHLESTLRVAGSDLSRPRVHVARSELLEPGAGSSGRVAGPACREDSVSPALSEPRSSPGSPKASTRLPASSSCSIASAYEYQSADGKTIKSVEHRAGWDATFSAPKSVSLTALVGGDERVRDAHRQAVTAA